MWPRPNPTDRTCGHKKAKPKSCMFAVLALLCTGCGVTGGYNQTSPAPMTPTPPSSTAPFGHVFLVPLENANYTDAIGSSTMPYLNGLANKYGLAKQYYA